MRTASVGQLAFTLGLAFALGCSSSNDPPPAGAAGSTSSMGGSSGSSGGSVTLPVAGTANGGAPTTLGGSGGVPTSGTSGSSSGGAGTANGGAGGRASAGAANGGTGGGGTCVPNLACKLAPPPSTGDIHQDCVDRINQFLTQCACLPALTRRADGEACATQMAEYDAAQNKAHAGSVAKICQPGGSQNECPNYASNTQVIGLCMQQMWDEGPPPTEPCTGDCYQKHGHFINMTDTSVKKVACGFHTTASGKVWAVQNFSR